jgi:hypothetical protein
MPCVLPAQCVATGLVCNCLVPGVRSQLPRGSTHESRSQEESLGVDLLSFSRKLLAGSGRRRIDLAGFWELDLEFINLRCQEQPLPLLPRSYWHGIRSAHKFRFAAPRDTLRSPTTPNVSAYHQMLL